MKLFIRDKRFYRRIFTIGGPIAIQQIVTVGVNMMDTVMLGRLDEVAISASAAATQVHTLFHFMLMGLGMGGSVLLARFYGAGEMPSFQKTLTLMYRMCLIMAAVFTIVVGAAPAAVMSLFTPSAPVIYEGTRYLRWALPCFFLYGLTLTSSFVLRNLGKTEIPMRVSFGAFFVNIFFNWVFIFGKLGAPEMGVAGAALGTLISRAFEFTFTFGYLLFFEKSIDFRIRNIAAPCKDMLWSYLRISMPVMISDTLLGVGNSVAMSIVGHISDAFMSANTITNVTSQITTVFTAALGQSAVIITGNTLGEGSPEQAMEQGYTYTALGFLIGAAAGIVIVLLSPWIVSGYNITDETKEIAMSLLSAVGLVTFFMAPGSILTKGILRGGGDTYFLMIADVVFLWLVSVPLGYLSAAVWQLPPFFILIALKIDHIIKTIVCIFRLRSGKWIKKIRAAA